MDVDDTVERSYVQVVAVQERGWRRPGHGPSPCLFALALMVVCAGDFLCLFYGFGSVEALRVPVVCLSFIAQVRCVGVCACPRPFLPYKPANLPSCACDGAVLARSQSPWPDRGRKS